jgi:hypothetical protein
MKKPPHKFGDWSRSEVTGYLEGAAIMLFIMLALKMAEHFL